MKSREARIADVREAHKALRGLIAEAVRVEESGASDAAKFEAWAEVELFGAVVHRQSRILAGKSRGG